MSRDQQLVGAFAYEHTDIPPGLTIAQWRTQRAAERRFALERRRAERWRALRRMLHLEVPAPRRVAGTAEVPR